MRRFSIYLLREMAPLYVIAVVTLLILLLIDYFSSLVSFFLANQVPIAVVAQAFIDRIPSFLAKALAPALAFSVLVGLGRLAKDSELKAAFTSGVPPLKLLRPVLGFGVVIAILSFINNNFWQPAADARYESNQARLGLSISNVQQVQSYADAKNDRLFHTGALYPQSEDNKNATLAGVMVIDKSGVYTSQTGLWDSKKKQWELYNVYYTPLDPSKEPTRFADRYTFPFDVNLSPFELPPILLPLDKLFSQAFNPALPTEERFQAEFRLHRRFSDAFAAILMAIVGGAIGLTVSNRAWAFASVIGLVFGYWVFWTLSESIASNYGLTPVLAGWLPIIVFAFGGVFAIRRLK